MIEPTLALQRAIGAALVADPAVTALVAPRSIVDSNRRPSDFPSIVIGDGQTVNAGLTYSRQHVRASLDVHIWTREAGLSGTKQIAGAVQAALRSPLIVEGIDLVDFNIEGARYMRDPSGEHGHAVLSIETLVGWRT